MNHDPTCDHAEPTDGIYCQCGAASFHPVKEPTNKLDPRSDEFFDRTGFRVGSVDIDLKETGITAYLLLYPSSARTGSSICFWRPVWSSEEDWRVSYASLQGVAVQAPPDCFRLDPVAMAAINRCMIGEPEGITDEDWRERTAYAVEAASERFYGSSYGLGL